MKKFWQIKWENILFVVLATATIYCGIKLYNYTSDMWVLAFTMLAVLFVLIFIASSKAIKNFRHEVIKHW